MAQTVARDSESSASLTVLSTMARMFASTLANNGNAKIQRITEGTPLVVGIGIVKHTHVARGVDWRCIELGMPLTFENPRTALEGLEQWLEKLKHSHAKDDVLIDMEPTRHYWMALVNICEEGVFRFIP